MSQPENPKLILELTPNGLLINGPIDNKVLSYGMLELAKDGIRDHVAAKSKSSILMPFPRINNGGGPG